ncbi:sugar transferase [Thermodesulfobacteriota bacterium B35]
MASGRLTRQYDKIIVQVNRFVDLFLVTVAFTLACMSEGYFHVGDPHNLWIAQQNYHLVLLIFLVCHYFSFTLFHVYGPNGTSKHYRILSNIIKGVLTGSIAAVFFLYLIDENGVVSRVLILSFIFYTIVLLAIFKFLLSLVLLRYRRNDCNYKIVLIIGTRERAREMVRAITDNPESGYRIIGCLDLKGHEERIGKQIHGNVKVIGTIADLRDILTSQTVDEIVFAVPLKIIDCVTKYISIAEKMGINIRIMPDFQIHKIMYRPECASIFLEKFVGMPTLALSSLPPANTGLYCKTAIDYVGAVALLVVTMPLFIMIGLAVKLTSKGPVIFKQTRCGLNGRTFTMYKFRTMIEGAESLKDHLENTNEMDGPVFKLRKDPRVTPVGRFLRKTSLDELPQLVNILKGEMSFVGPRPPLPSEVKKYKLWQRRRLSMKPGLTCIWQVSGRNNLDFEQWMKLDLQYIDNWSIWLDLKLLVLTFREVLVRSGC